MQVSGTIVDKSGRTLSGQTTEAFLVSITHSRPMWYACDMYSRTSLIRTDPSTYSKITEAVLFACLMHHEYVIISV